MPYISHKGILSPKRYIPFAVDSLSAGHTMVIDTHASVARKKIKNTMPQLNPIVIVSEGHIGHRCKAK